MVAPFVPSCRGCVPFLWRCRRRFRRAFVPFLWPFPPFLRGVLAVVARQTVVYVAISAAPARKIGFFWGLPSVVGCLVGGGASRAFLGRFWGLFWLSVPVIP